MSSPSASKIATASRSTPTCASPRLIERLGLHRPALRAWILYDWASSAVVTTIIAAIFPVYFYNVVSMELPSGFATRRFALVNAVAMLALALAPPILGAIADLLSVKKRLLGFLVATGSISAAAMFGIHAGDWRPHALSFVAA